MIRVAVIGAGLVKLSRATRPAEAGSAVALHDEGRGPGGRLRTQRIATSIGEAQFDRRVRRSIGSVPA